MNIGFKNGSTVSRMWGDLSDGELLAAFQYGADALLFANVFIQSGHLPKETWLVVTDHYSGKVTVVRKPPASIENPAAQAA